jgi:hypothetical protein
MYLVKTALLFLLFIAAECVYSQPCTLIVTEHTELDESNLRDHLSWLKSYAEDTNQQLILHVCSRDNKWTRYGGEDVLNLIESDSLLDYINPNNRVNFNKEYDHLAKLSSSPMGRCLTESAKVKVIIASPNTSIKVQRLDFIRKLSLINNWVLKNGDIKDNVEIIVVNGYQSDESEIKIETIYYED